MKKKEHNPDKTGRQQGGRFAPGVSGNPSGRPIGSRHKATLAVQELLDGDAEKISRKAIDMALMGDSTAMRLCLERIIPARKDSPINIQLPQINSVGEASQLMSALVGAVGTGEMTPSEGSEMAKLVETYIRTMQATEIENRVRALEERIIK